jgi:tripartite ATP-independent transporter DctM subunit
MEWYIYLIFILGGLIFLMATGMPVAFAFIVINIICVYIFWGGTNGLEQLILSIGSSVTTFSLMPVPLFIFMGSILFNSGITSLYIEKLDQLMGNIPGRMSILAIIAGVLFATLTAVSMASVAVLGAAMAPEMKKYGYKKSMILGPILAAGGLAHMIPPSDLGVILGGIGQISVGGILMAIIFPGLLLATLYCSYIYIRVKLNPDLAPTYKIKDVSYLDKIKAFISILPATVIIFAIVGFIYLGLATPTEAAATGVLASLFLIILYKKLTWEIIKKSMSTTISITALVFMLIVGAKAFSQILAFTGAVGGLMNLAVSLQLPSIIMIFMMQIIILFLGTFMEVISIMMITLPLFLPIVKALGYDLVWFAVLFLINTETALITPPFGMSLFVMKNVSPAGTTMGDIYRSIIPYVILQIVTIALIMIFPQIALYLPQTMKGN